MSEERATYETDAAVENWERTKGAVDLTPEQREMLARGVAGGADALRCERVQMDRRLMASETDRQRARRIMNDVNPSAAEAAWLEAYCRGIGEGAPARAMNKFTPSPREAPDYPVCDLTSEPEAGGTPAAPAIPAADQAAGRTSRERCDHPGCGTFRCGLCIGCCGAEEYCCAFPELALDAWRRDLAAYVAELRARAAWEREKVGCKPTAAVEAAIADEIEARFLGGEASQDTVMPGLGVLQADYDNDAGYLAAFAPEKGSTNG